MYQVYVLKSVNENRYYIGHTQDITRRLAEHNSGKNRSTKAYVPWKCVYSELCTTKQEAYAREMKIKSYKGGRAFKSMLSVAGGVA